MATEWLTLSFGASLITNVGVFCSILSMMYWVGERKVGWVSRWHDYLQMTICWLFLLYLFLMSAVDGHFSPAFFGSHWTYFNLMIVASFLFNMAMISWLYFGVLALGTIGFVMYMPGPVTPLRIGLTVFVIAIQALLTARGGDLWPRRGILYPLMAVYSCVNLLIMALGAAPKDEWFWFRQIFALVVEFIVAYEYLRLLVRQRRANDRYREEAIRDRMTGLKNFGTFNSDLQRLYQRNQSTGANFWLMELDVDHFKHINDTYGHLVGNTVLESVAHDTRAYADTLGYQTMVYRMGGEEFCLLIEGGEGDRDQAVKVAQRLRCRLADLHFKGDDATDFHITVSIGAEHARAEDKHYLDIYNRVDKYLYDAKQSGRDAVSVCGVLVQ